jgi:DNA-directed RNA polymerase specialized sigma24 family protein
MKNKYLQETIECLGNYKEYRAKLESKKEFLKKLKSERENNDREVGIKSMTYDEAPAKTNKVTSIVEKIAIKNIQMELDLEEEIDSLQYYLMRIDLALVELKDEWKQVLQLKYIEGYPWEYVAIKMGQSKATCRRNGDKAVKAFADRIQGQESYIDLPLFRYIYIEQVE